MTPTLNLVPINLLVNGALPSTEERASHDENSVVPARHQIKQVVSEIQCARMHQSDPAVVGSERYEKYQTPRQSTRPDEWKPDHTNQCRGVITL